MGPPVVVTRVLTQQSLKLVATLKDRRFRAGAAMAAFMEVIRDEDGAARKFQTLLMELRAAARELPITARSDGGLDLSRLPEDARRSVERLGSLALRYVPGGPPSESATV